MKPIYIFRHIACEGPGYFAEALRRRALPFEVIAIDLGAAVPADPNDASALVFMGGSMSVNDPLPWLAAEVQLIRHAHAIGMPVLGLCLGGRNAAPRCSRSPMSSTTAGSAWWQRIPIDAQTDARANEVAIRGLHADTSRALC